MNTSTTSTIPGELNAGLSFGNRFLRVETHAQELAEIGADLEGKMEDVFAQWQEELDKHNSLAALPRKLLNSIFRVLLQDMPAYFTTQKSQDYLSQILVPAVQDLFTLGVTGDYLVLLFHNWETTLYAFLQQEGAGKKFSLSYFLLLDQFFHIMLMHAISTYVRLELEGRSLHPLVRMTTRQKEILTRLAQGEDNKDIAKAFGISVRTVESHRLRMMRKAGATNLAELLRFAFRSDIISS